MITLFRLLLLFLFFSSCTSEQAPAITSERTPFFDLEEYFNRKIDSLQNQKVQVRKTIQLNGEKESQVISDLDFSKDLKIFRDSDINRPAWVDKYEVKETELSGSHRLVDYIALDSSLQTQSLLVEFDRGQVIRIEIDRHTGTVLSDGKYHLMYDVGKGYMVKTKQTNRFSRDIDAVIQVEFQ